MPIYPLPDLMPALPEMFVVCSAMALLMVGAFRGEGSTRLVSWLAVAALIVTIGLVVATGVERRVALNGLFITDGFAAFMKILVLIGSAASIVMAMAYNERERIARFEFPVLILLATTGMLMMISAADLISLYIGLELQSLALYVVASFKRDTATSSEAGLKYFVLGALSSGMLLYGCSMIYGFSGTTSFEQLAATFAGGEYSIGIVIGMVFVSVGLAFKCSAVPFHMWTPDVYEGAPTPVTAFFSVAPKIAAIALFMRFLVEPFGGLVAEWRQIIEFIAIASMLLGAFAAINQRNIKRLMAYSSIGHVGYALIGLAAGTADGIRGVLIYMAIYLVMNLGTFMFSMAGIPPLAGFISKLYVFMAAIDAGLYVLAVIGVVTSVVGAFYYLRIVKLVYFDESTGVFDQPIGNEMRGVLVVTAVLVLLFFVFPGPLATSADAAAAALFAG
jgi:NADH-quinone oxidoreductase subunit N